MKAKDLAILIPFLLYTIVYNAKKHNNMFTLILNQCFNSFKVIFIGKVHEVNHGTNNGIKIQQYDFDATFNDCFQLLDVAIINLIEPPTLAIGSNHTTRGHFKHENVLYF
jgi:hypothetical protein